MDEKMVFKWTIEHIFPEGKNIPDKWVDIDWPLEIVIWLTSILNSMSTRSAT